MTKIRMAIEYSIKPVPCGWTVPLCQPCVSDKLCTDAYSVHIIIESTKQLGIHVFLLLVSAVNMLIFKAVFQIELNLENIET